MNKLENVQVKFFDYLIKRRGIKTVIDQTMVLLHLRKGAVYKRINGDTTLSMAEMVTLADYFKVSIDNILRGDKYITFQHPFLYQKSMDNFMDQFTFFLKPLQSKDSSSLTYLANELPVFYYFSYPQIFNFVLSIWNHIHWAEGRLRIEENKLISTSINYIREEINSYYQGSPVTEIWNSNMFANLYQQIIFAITIRAFENISYLDKLLIDIQHLINELKELANQGNNAQDKARTIYLNDFGNYLNILLYESEKVTTTFIGYDIPQFLVSYNSNFLEFSKNWINKIRKRSVLISTEGYQGRELFFIKIESDYKLFTEKVDKLVPIYYS